MNHQQFRLKLVEHGLELPDEIEPSHYDAINNMLHEWRACPHNRNKLRLYVKRDGEWHETVFTRFKAR